MDFWWHRHTAPGILGLCEASSSGLNGCQSQMKVSLRNSLLKNMDVNPGAFPLIQVGKKMIQPMFLHSTHPNFLFAIPPESLPKKKGTRPQTSNPRIQHRTSSLLAEPLLSLYTLTITTLLSINHINISTIQKDKNVPNFLPSSTVQLEKSGPYFHDELRFLSI